jgi:hypothetical protein
MAAAWRTYAASGKAAAAAAPFITADAATMVCNPLSDLQGNLPGLREISEAASDDDADIIITTIVVDSADQSMAQLPGRPSSSNSSRASLPLGPPCRGVTKASLGVQIRVLSGRALLWWLRNPAMLLAGEGFLLLHSGRAVSVCQLAGQALRWTTMCAGDAYASVQLFTYRQAGRLTCVSSGRMLTAHVLFLVPPPPHFPCRGWSVPVCGAVSGLTLP